MPCMCGDPYCGSCGPAQGYFQCPICGAWSQDGGCENPEECREANRLEAEKEAKYYEELDEEKEPNGINEYNGD
jgi:hypothetical protein